VGYLWCFPRSDHANLGIGARLGTVSVSELWQRLETFLGKYYPQARKKKRWAALLPSVSKPDFWRQPCAGDNWALIGDAAGQVDCMIGAGIPYAFASANLVAQAILRGDLKSYDRAWRGEFGKLLERSSTIMSQIVRSGDTANFERAVVHLLGGNTAFTKPGLQPAV
jgi:flavin-dependent dehydrogenase